MLQCLVASDANNIWECTLTEGTLGKLSKRKPSYKDALQYVFAPCSYLFSFIMPTKQSNKSQFHSSKV